MSDSNRSKVDQAGLTQQQDAAGQRQASNQRADETQTDTGGNELTTSKVTNAPTVETVDTQATTQIDQQRQDADLAAQQDMAFYALLMFIATAITVVFTGIGIWLLKRTLDTTREAVEDTSEATDAMRAANEIARDSSERQLRAYVGSEDHEIYGFVTGVKSCLICKVYNRGQTPAHDLKIWSNITATTGSPHEAKIFKGGEIEQSRTTIGPGQYEVHENPMNSPLAPESYEGTSLGGISIVWGGVISYTDAFGRRRRTTFKKFLRGSGADLPHKVDLIGCARGNEAN